jgi:hypothetical protein
MLNGVSVILPEMYHNGWLVVHGISEVLEFPEQVVDVASPPEFGSGDSEAFDNSSTEGEGVKTEPTKQVADVPSSPEFNSSDHEVFANSATEDEVAIHALLCLQAFIILVPFLSFCVFWP